MAGSDRPSPATFLLTRNAALDLRRIHALSRREWGDDVADRYLADLYAAMGDAAANPERGRGMLISDGVRNWQVAQDGQALDLSGWHLDSLFIQVPNSLLGDHGLELRATSVEPSNGSTASRSATFTLRALSGAAVATPANANSTRIPADDTASRCRLERKRQLSEVSVYSIGQRTTSATPICATRTDRKSVV